MVVDHDLDLGIHRREGLLDRLADPVDRARAVNDDRPGRGWPPRPRTGRGPRPVVAAAGEGQAQERETGHHGGGWTEDHREQFWLFRRLHHSVASGEGPGTPWSSLTT